MYSYRKTVWNGLAGVCLFAGLALAQPVDDAPYRSASVGFRTGGNVFDLIHAEPSTATDLTGPPAVTVTTAAESQSGRFFLGPTVQLNATRKWSVEIDFLTRKVAYQIDAIVDTQGDEDDPPTFVREDIDTIEARYWDIPVLVKRYLTPPGAKARPYFAAGVGLRNATGPSGERLTLLPEDFEADEDGVVDPVGVTTSLEAEFARSTVAGAIAAAGFETSDDFNIKFNLEARYTRWFSSPIDAGFARSNLNQLEIVVGLSF